MAIHKLCFYNMLLQTLQLHILYEFFFGFLGVLRPIKKSLLLKRLLLYLISSSTLSEKECRMCRSRTCPYVGGVLSNSWVLSAILPVKKYLYRGVIKFGNPRVPNSYNRPKNRRQTTFLGLFQVFFLNDGCIKTCSRN